MVGKNIPDLSLEFSPIEVELLEALKSSGYSLHKEKKTFKGEEYYIYYDSILLITIEVYYFSENYRKLCTRFLNNNRVGYENHTTETPPELEKLLKYIKKEVELWSQKQR